MGLGDKLKPGEGEVVKRKGQEVARYKKVSGEVIELSAVCTHAQCTVEWDKTAL